MNKFIEVPWSFTKTYVHNLLVALDEFASAALFGDPGETISSRVGKSARAGNWSGKLGQLILDSIFGKGHCARSIEDDRGSKRLLEY